MKIRCKLNIHTCFSQVLYLNFEDEIFIRRGELQDPEFIVPMNSKFRVRSVKYLTGNSQINSNF